MGCSSLLGPFCFEDESVVSIPFMLMEGIADVKVLFMNWTQRQYFRLKKKKLNKENARHRLDCALAPSWDPSHRWQREGSGGRAFRGRL